VYIGTHTHATKRQFSVHLPYKSKISVHLTGKTKKEGRKPPFFLRRDKNINKTNYKRDCLMQSNAFYLIYSGSFGNFLPIKVKLAYI
jgi:hypothetical protein